MSFLSLESALLWVYNRLIPSCLAIASLVGLWFLGQSVELPLYDTLLRWSAKPAASSPVTLILIDNESIARLTPMFGPMPWPRKRYLEIFRAVNRKHPAVMLFDGHFVDIEQADDAQFFKSLAEFPNLISGVVMPEDNATGVSLNPAMQSYYLLNLGVVSVSEDTDGVIRRLKPFYSLRIDAGNKASSERTFLALSVAGAREWLNQTQPEKHWKAILSGERKAQSLSLLPERAPGLGKMLRLGEEQAFQMRWYRILNPGKAEYARSHPAIPLWRLMEQPGQVPDLTGRIALIGSSSSFYRDYHQTPLAKRHAGPDIHATAIDNILQGASIWKVSPWLNMILLYGLCFMTFQIRMGIRGFGKTLLYTLGAMIIYFWLAFWLLAEYSVQIDVATPEMFVVAAFLAGSAFRIFFKEKQLAAMERNLSQLVDPEVYREIRRLSHVLKPGGEKLEITSMFVDIRNFTTLAERLQPHDVTELLNEFYEAIVNIVFSYHGTIDKFMGDGILIIFGAPLPNEQHRALALRAALDILEATEQLSAQWKTGKGIDTEMGITLNSGIAFVGFLGPADKLEYTGVGDTVNICVRLQEHAKQFQTRLIMSEETLMGVPEALQDCLPFDAYVPLGEVALRGRESTLRIFSLRQAFLK